MMNSTSENYSIDVLEKRIKRLQSKVKSLESIARTNSVECLNKKAGLEKRYSRSKAKEAALSKFIQTKIIELFHEKELLFKNYRRSKAKESALTKLIETRSSEIYYEKEKVESLLLNILPAALVNELKEKNTVKAQYFESASVIFTDFVGFTSKAEKMTPDVLVTQLDNYFRIFDEFAENRNLEKLKTIGDSYMCVGGLPEVNNTHPIDACLFGLKLLQYMETINRANLMKNIEPWDIRIGINSGPVMAGIIGKKKFAYDIWGDTVNIASRMESSSGPNCLNISQSTFEIINSFFECEFRGKIPVKRLGDQPMYFVKRIKPEMSEQGAGTKPNALFRNRYYELLNS